MYQFGEQLSEVIIDEFNKNPDDFKSSPSKKSFLRLVVAMGQYESSAAILTKNLLDAGPPFEEDFVDFSNSIKETQPHVHSLIERKFLEENVPQNDGNAKEKNAPARKKI